MALPVAATLNSDHPQTVSDAEMGLAVAEERGDPSSRVALGTLAFMLARVREFDRSAELADAALRACSDRRAPRGVPGGGVLRRRVLPRIRRARLRGRMRILEANPVDTADVSGLSASWWIACGDWRTWA